MRTDINGHGDNYIKIEENNRLKLKGVLLQISLFLKESTNSVLSEISSEEVLRIILKEINNLSSGKKVDIKKLDLHFAPTSSLQEISMDNNWTEEYLRLSSEYDKLIKIV